MKSFSDLIYHATLERVLMESFPLEVFQKLHLPLSTHPKIYQNLPRYSEPLYPKHLFVREEFSHLPVLKKRCIDKALLSLYEDLSYPSAQTITLFTYVIPGGLGDYFAQQLVKNYLQRTFPHLCIHTLSLLHETAPLSSLEHDERNHLVPFSSIADLIPAALPSHLLELLRHSSLILQIPTLYPHWELLIRTLLTLPSSHPMPDIETIGEYGFICHPPFYPDTATRCLGLHFLEHGLLLESPTSHPLSALKDNRLRSFHLGHPSHHFYFAYLCTDSGHTLYLHTLLHYLAQDKKNIDLCTPDIGPFLKALDGITCLCRSTHIKEIQVFYKNHYSVIPIQDHGKTVRLIHTGPLDHQTFKTLLHASEEPVGIRGNLSLSEAIALNKVYFYDPLKHNTTLYYGLVSMAESLAPHAKALLKLYHMHEMPIQTAIDLAELMHHSPALEALRSLGKTIQEQHNAMPYLGYLVSRTLKQRTCPHLKQQESLFIEAFCHGHLTFKDVIVKLRETIKKI